MAQEVDEPTRSRRLALRTLNGDPVNAGGVTVTPQLLALTLRLPFASFVWQRPAAVIVERDGRTTRLPIRDATRLVQCALIGVGVLLALIGRLLVLGRKERQR